MGCMKDGLPSPSHGKRGRHDRLRLASASFLANKLGRARNKTKVTGHSLQNLVTPFLDELRWPPLPLPPSLPSSFVSDHHVAVPPLPRRPLHKSASSVLSVNRFFPNSEAAQEQTEKNDAAFGNL